MISRRASLLGTGASLAAMATAREGRAATSKLLLPPNARLLRTLTVTLQQMPRRRDFKSVPMILESRDQWDARPLDAVLRYVGWAKQSWDVTDLQSPWLNYMRNALNSQIFSYKHPDFLCVAVTHGTAQLAMYDDYLWDKYGLAKAAGGDVTKNTFVVANPTAANAISNIEDPAGAYSGKANGIQQLQRRGAVFLVCHNAIWEFCEKLIAAGNNPDHLTNEQMCAEFSNHLIPGAILTPGAVGTLVELGRFGFVYAR